MALISDAIQPAGLGNGEFTVWGARIAVRDGSTALVDGPAAGALAGSVITLREALKNVVSLGVPLHEAIKMASLQPLRVAGLDRENGSIQAGKHADMIAVGGNFDIEMVIARGEVIVR